MDGSGGGQVRDVLLISAAARNNVGGSAEASTTFASNSAKSGHLQIWLPLFLTSPNLDETPVDLSEASRFPDPASFDLSRPIM